MRQIVKSLKTKSNRYLLLCILLLLSFSTRTLYATEIVATTSTSTGEDFTVEDYDGTYYITASGGVNVRLGPSTQYDIIGNLLYGEKIAVTGKTNNGWYEISYQGENGYIAAKYVSSEPVAIISFETEEIPEVTETITEEYNLESEYSTIFSDNTVVLLLVAIIVMVIVIILTIISFFRINHTNKYEHDHKTHC